MRFEATKQLYSYWLNLKGSRMAPERSEIEPSDIRNLLGDTFILEVNHDAKYVIYRLAGSRLCAAYGRELKGEGYLVAWNEEDNLDILHAVTKVYSNFMPCLIGYLGQTEQKRFIQMETLLLPLLPLSDNTARILGISSPVKTPFWLGAEPIVTNKLRSLRQLSNTQAQKDNKESQIPAPPMQFDETANQPQTSNKPLGNVSHLTLIDGGKP